jgi:ribosomal protein L11 methyltransferase
MSRGPRDEQRPAPPPRVIRLAVRVRGEDAELVLAELLELAPSGVEETEVGEGVIEYAVYGSPGELPELPDLRAAVGDALVEIATTELPDDWSERWKRFHRPVLIEAPAPVPPSGPSPPAPSAPASHAEGKPLPPTATRKPLPALHVRPPWEPPSDRSDAREIVIDPAQAFGTGAHATTRLCLELLLEVALRDDSRGPLLDIGTGSGVLAIAAAHLGYAPVIGLDNESEGVEAARANALVNGVDLDVRLFDLRAESLPWAGDMPPVVMANLLRPLLLDLARLMPAAPRHLLACGLLAHEVDEVVQAFEVLGLRKYERRHRGEWAAVWLRVDCVAEG